MLCVCFAKCPCTPICGHSHRHCPCTPMYGPSHHGRPSILMHRHSPIGYHKFTSLQWLRLIKASVTVTQKQCGDVSPCLPMAAKVGTAGSREHRLGTNGEEAIVSMTVACTNATPRRSFPRYCRVHTCPWGPLLKEGSMHMWDAGRGRDASPVHSLVVVLRGRKSCTGRRYQALMQCR